MKNCTITTLFIKNIEIADGRAETIMVAMKQWIMENKVGFERCVGFGSDGASVMVGSKTGVATRMKAMNPFIVSTQNRFPEQETDLLNAMVIFDMQQLPTAATELANSGTAELEVLIKHYGEGKNGDHAPYVDSNACRDEWMLTKQLVAKNYPAMEMRPLWELL